jgi:hypothetical protein
MFRSSGVTVMFATREQILQMAPHNKLPLRCKIGRQLQSSWTKDPLHHLEVAQMYLSDRRHLSHTLRAWWGRMITSCIRHGSILI